MTGDVPVVRYAAACVALAILLAATATLGAPRRALSELRMTPAEVAALPVESEQIGSSGLSGVHTKILFGDPTKSGFYTILLFVPANTTIQAHSHRDDRMATVVSGTWRFGYGSKFDAAALKPLPPGSVYSEPGGASHSHFAQTKDEPVIVSISGYGPTDTTYANPADDPAGSDR